MGIPDFFRSDRPLVIGHRGARVSVVENTMSAFTLAQRVGADGVELDVRLSKDGEVVVLHDADLARVTGDRDPRLAEELTARDLSRVDLEGDGVPRLVEVLELCRDRGLLVNVEMKRDVPDRKALVSRVAALLGSWDPRAPMMVSSFDPLMLAFLGALTPRVPRALLVHRSSYHDWMSLAPPLIGATLVNAEDVLIDEQRMRSWKHRAVSAWTVGSANRARRLRDLGVRGIITDDPAYILAALAR